MCEMNLQEVDPKELKIEVNQVWLLVRKIRMKIEYRERERERQ